MEENQKGLIPPGLLSWQLQHIEHPANTTSVAPPPACPAGCRPLYLLHLLILSFTIRAPNGCCILQFRAYQSFVCNLLSTPRCESQVPTKELGIGTLALAPWLTLQLILIFFPSTGHDKKPSEDLDISVYVLTPIYLYNEGSGEWGFPRNKVLFVV